ncbi:hypothetical protein MM716_35035, partial [Klebsiella pneumoniae]|nr:hypothetical protein [Klebsiella pneumoniae]
SIEEFKRIIAKPIWCDEVFWAYRKPGQTDRPDAARAMVLSLDMIYIRRNKHILSSDGTV